MFRELTTRAETMHINLCIHSYTSYVPPRTVGCFRLCQAKTRVESDGEKERGTKNQYGVHEAQ